MNNFVDILLGAEHVFDRAEIAFGLLVIMASDFDIKKGSKGEYYWVLNAANGQVLCKSTDGYVSKSSCKDSIKIVKALAPVAPLWDMTGEKPERLDL